MFKRNELVAFGLAVVLLLSLLTFKAFVPTGMSVGVVQDGMLKVAESTHFTNLDVVEDFSVGDDATVTGDLLVSGSLTAAAGGGAVGVWTLNATDAVTVGGTAKIVGATTMTGNVDIKGIVSSDTINILRLNENTVVTGTFGASGLATLGTANVTGAFQGGSTGLFNGTLTAASLVVTGSNTWTGQLAAGNGLLVTQNITQVSGSFILNSGTVSGTLGVAGIGTFASQLYADNGLRVTQNITQVSGSTILNTATVSGTLDVQGLVSSNAGNILQLNENTVVTGTLALSGDADLNGALDVAGIVSSADNDFRLNDNALISGTLTASGAADLNSTLGIAGIATFESEAHADNGLRITGNITQVSGSAILNSASVTSTLAANTLSATDNITASKSLTATYYGGFGATYFAISSTVDYTTGATIVLSAVPKGIVPITTGGPGATLDAGASISDGAYLGQILVISNVDGTAGHTLVIKNAANTSIGKDRTLDVNDSIGLYWDGTNWVLMWLTDSSA